MLYKRTFIFSIAAVFIPISAAYAKTTHVYGANQGDCVTYPQTCDRVVLQNAVDNAKKNDVLHLHGIFQLDSVRPILIEKSNITLKGDTIANNNSCAVSNVSPTEIRGVLSGTAPLGDLLVNDANKPYDCDGIILNPSAGNFLVCARNSGISISSYPDQVKHVEIKGIKFSNFTRAVTMQAGFGNPRAPLLCSDWENIGITINYDGIVLPQLFNDTVRGGKLSDVTIKENAFCNSLRDVQLFGGESKNIDMKNNVFIGNGQNNPTNGIAVVLGGNIGGCVGPAGQTPTQSNTLDIIGLLGVKDVKVTNNYAEGNLGFASFINTTDSLFKNNVIRNSVLSAFDIRGVQSQRSTISDTSNVEIKKNVIDGVALGAGIRVRHPNPGMLIKNNQISNIAIPGNARPYGIHFDMDSSGSFINIGAAYIKACKNIFSNAGQFDVFLTSGSHDNQVLGNIFTYSDLGTNNTVIQGTNSCGVSLGWGCDTEDD